MTEKICKITEEPCSECYTSDSPFCIECKNNQLNNSLFLGLLKNIDVQIEKYDFAEINKDSVTHKEIKSLIKKLEEI